VDSGDFPPSGGRKLRDVLILRHNRRTVRIPTLTALVIAIISLVPAACSNSGAPVAAATDGVGAGRQVSAVPAAEQPLDRVVTVTGTLAAEDQVALAFKVAGRIDVLNVDLGSPVTEGAVVARLLPADFEFRLDQAEAALQQARARLGLQAVARCYSRRGSIATA
jgi:multidrug efflux pump subunit AcrA (membrane-fusion protein)